MNDIEVFYKTLISILRKDGEVLVSDIKETLKAHPSKYKDILYDFFIFVSKWIKAISSFKDPKDARVYLYDMARKYEWKRYIAHKKLHNK